MSRRTTDMGGGREVPATSWRLVLGAASDDETEARRRLDELARCYWKPVYHMLRSQWNASNEDAKDLTQGFFATVVFERQAIKAYVNADDKKRGRFRFFLLACIKRFLLEQHRNATTLKQGGHLVIESLQAIDPEQYDLQVPVAPN